MTKEEFEALGITERDLVCVKTLGKKKVGTIKLLIDDYNNIIKDRFYYVINFHPDAANRKGFNLKNVKSIDIITKDFWK